MTFLSNLCKQRPEIIVFSGFAVVCVLSCSTVGLATLQTPIKESSPVVQNFASEVSFTELSHSPLQPPKISVRQAAWEMARFLGGLPGIPVLVTQHQIYKKQLEKWLPTPIAKPFNKTPMPQGIYAEQPSIQALSRIYASGIINLLEAMGESVNEIIFPDALVLKNGPFTNAEMRLFSKYQKTAKKIVDFIPSQCPAQKMGKSPICHYNPLYDHLIALRMRAEEYLSLYQTYIEL